MHDAAWAGLSVALLLLLILQGATADRWKTAAREWKTAAGEWRVASNRWEKVAQDERLVRERFERIANDLLDQVHTLLPSARQ